MTSPIPLEEKISELNIKSGLCFKDDCNETHLESESIEQILALIQTVCERAIGTDEDVRLFPTINKVRNSLRASQRQTLKDIISGKQKL